MHTPPTFQPSMRTVDRLALAALLGWSGIIAIVFILTLSQEKSHLLNQARLEGITHLNKDLSFRQWATSHGGVYVKPSASTPPNPYLHAPDRDVTTREGMNLTLMNPAYMLREVMEHHTENYGVRGHITSLKLLNPDNAPDAWEKETLESFERGVYRERAEQAEIDGKPYLRIMRAMIMEPGCIVCHEASGVPVGGVRGGISTAVPLTPYLEGLDRFFATLLTGLGLVWVAGVVALWFARRQSHRFLIAQAQASTAVAEREARFRGLFLDSPAALWEVDLSALKKHLDAHHPGLTRITPTIVAECAHLTRIIRVNQATVDLLRAPSMEAMQGSQLQRFFDAHGLETFTQALDAFYNGATRFATETTQVTFQGQVIWISLSISLSPESETNWQRFYVSMIDITQRHQVEHLLRDELERNRHLTWALDQDLARRKRDEELMRQAKEVAENANRAKSEFLAMMSHEIRTPMNVVIGMGDLLLESGVRDEQREWVARLQEAGANLMELINQILDLTKIESGHLTLIEEPVAIRDLVFEVAGMLKVVAEGKGLEMHCAVSPDVPPILLFDRLRLRQILFNLLGNAIKFTDAGRITLNGLVDPDHPGRIILLVRDTGIGISPEKSQTIFDPFTQVDTSMTRRHGGSGLGLTIARRLVTLMNGEISVESQPGRGSAFRIALPARPATNHLPARPESAGLSSGGADAECPAMRILLVEDSEDNQLLISAFLKKSPHHLTIAVNGEEAVAMVQTEAFDLVFMDVQMPVMDGYTATRRIRDWEKVKGRFHLPIVTLTAHALEGEAERSRQAGCDLYLSKPINKQKLLDVVARFGLRSHAE
ncbi:Sensor histidine kinase RcsC [Candidatus Magnetaquicoccaceae bacterium FCR-1]|uniref:histidine kinase n=1 Tax=Candidatus Magnetaquiglobus chichijimensis TaxID=3141448 RepID=A0ABQ0C9F6_9PROT